MTSDDEFFAGIEPDQDQFRQMMQEVAESSVNYGIYFTPRSGSSWLTSVLRGSAYLGNPEEWFNPNFIPRIAASLHARNLDDYVGALRRRKRGKNGVFGFEITYFQMMKVFKDRRPWDYFSPDMKSFILVRRDIVMQAVSLYKATETNVFHSVSSDEETRKDADQKIRYDPEKIAKWAMHILNQELGLLEILDHLPGVPVPLYYEDIVSSPETTAALFSKHLGIDLSSGAPPQSKHIKIATDKNVAFKERFMSEERDFADALIASRAGLLERMRRLTRHSAAERVS